MRRTLRLAVLMVALVPTVVRPEERERETGEPPAMQDAESADGSASAAEVPDRASADAGSAVVAGSSMQVPLASVVPAAGAATFAASSAPPASDPRYSVVPTGAFTYTYPIEVPPGTNGVAPSLSLAYNSASGNGMLGMGFALTGLPTIERDPSYPITFTGADHYIYQGQKLIWCSVDSSFHPERETFVRIRAFAGDLEDTPISNPNTTTSHWVVYRKADTPKQRLQQHQARMGGRSMVLEPELRKTVDTRVNLCSVWTSPWVTS